MAAVSFERNGCPYFFKILSPDSLTVLVIPRNFVKNLDKSALKTATLFSHSNKFWHIQILLNLDDELDVQFGRGWELFVRAHSLKSGNFLLFRYQGNTVFSVKIFHSDGCCAWYDCNDLDAAPRCLVQDLAITTESISFKQQTNSTITNKEKTKKSENTCVKSKASQKSVRNKDEQIFRFERILRSYNVDLTRAQICLPPLQGLVVYAGKSEMISLDCLGRLWPIRLWVGLNEKIVITTGWKQLVRETKLKEGDKCIFQTLSQGVLGLKIQRKT